MILITNVSTFKNRYKNRINFIHIQCDHVIKINKSIACLLNVKLIITRYSTGTILLPCNIYERKLPK